MTNLAPTLSQDEFCLINELLTERFGIHFPDRKREILESRLRPRLEAHGLSRFMDYYLLLQFGLNGARNEEIEQLIGSVTNNETYFFRETHQFDALFGQALDDLRASSPFRRGLRFLCAGCSSGEEPLTLNTYVRENQYRLGAQAVTIDAFDLDRDKIKTALAGEYGERSLRALSQEQIQRYFSVTGDGRYRLKPMYRNGVRFSTGNILERSTIQVAGVYDVIFCRNVLIYFSDETLLKAAENFAYWLRPGGLLFLGHSESLLGKSDAYEAVRLNNCIVYRRR